MKRVLGMLLLASAVATTGCSLFDKKEEDNGGNGGQQQQQGGQPQGGGMDLTKMVKAPGMLAKWDGAAKGWMIRTETEASGTKTAGQYSIVNETDDVWHVEMPVPSAYHAMSPEAKDMVIGMVVNKEDGKVTKAVMGKKGEAGKEIGITPAPEGTAKAPEGEATEVKVEAGGPYPCKLYTNEVANYGTIKSWVGTTGDTKGVQLKVENPNGKYELKEIGSESVDVGGTSVDCKKLVYTNGNTMWMTEHDVIKVMGGGMAKHKSEAATITVVAVGKDAAAELKWE